MSYQNPPISESGRRREYQYAVAHEKLQADPELAAAEGRAGPLLITAYFAVMVFFVCVVLYGLNHQRNEAEETGAATMAAPAENASPPPAPKQQPNTQQGNQGGPNPSAKQPQAQPQQNPPPAKQQAKPANGQQGQQPANGQPQQAQPNAQQPKQAPAAQQQTPAPKQ
jgi:hypothetical protein